MAVSLRAKDVPQRDSLRVALVHDWITGMRGGEKCLEAFLEIYPHADIYTLIHIKGATTEAIDARVAGTSFLQRLPGIEKFYRHLLFLFPLAIRSLKYKREYDLIISLSHAAAKNIRVPGNALHVCYCFTPMRYIWDQAYQYFGKLTVLLWPLIMILRRWDIAGSKTVHHFIAISSFIAARIRCYYGRRSTVIFPPVNTGFFEAGAGEKPEGFRTGYFLYAGALVPYKKVGVIIQVFQELNLPLVIAGDGPDRAHLEALAQGSNITFAGQVSNEDLRKYMAGCRALLFPGKEDFGIIPIECLATGRPVVAGYHGALKESLAGIKSWSTESETGQAVGVFFKVPAKKSSLAVELKHGVTGFLDRENYFQPEACQAHARKFSKEAFLKMWETFERDIVCPESEQRARC